MNTGNILSRGGLLEVGGGSEIPLPHKNSMTTPNDSTSAMTPPLMFQPVSGLW